MTNDEVRQQMEFIVNQQAQTVVNLQNLSEKQVQAEERISNLEGAFVGLINIVADTNTRIAESAQRLELAMKARDTKTDERLNALINMVERHLSDPNGHSQN